MGDIIDRANDAADRFNQQAIDACRGGSQTARPSLTLCIECSKPIPEERRKAAPGCKRCVSCQQDIEHDDEYWRVT